MEVATPEIDRWVKEGVFNGFTPAAEIVKDGEDAVVHIHDTGSGGALTVPPDSSYLN